MPKSGKIRIRESEHQRLNRVSTKVYLKNVMRKVFRGKSEDHLQKLLAGDSEMLSLCASRLELDMDCFPLLHTLCLVTGRRFDLDEKDPAKAADAWLCWYGENRDRLAWDTEKGLWTCTVGS